MDDNSDAYAIDEFCTRHRLSRAFYYKLKNQHLGPRETRLGGKIIISKEAAEEWRRQREAASLGVA